MSRPHPTKGKRLRRDLLTERELDALIDACGDGDAALRNRAFVATVAGTGLRISEALQIRLDGVDLRKRRLNLGERTVWIHPHARPHLRAWLKRRAHFPGDVVFSNLEGEAISTSYLRRLLPRLAKDAKIRKRVHADGLRHVFARRAFESDITLRTLQIQFGHANVVTTMEMLEGLGLHREYDHFDAAFS